MPGLYWNLFCEQSPVAFVYPGTFSQKLRWGLTTGGNADSLKTQVNRKQNTKTQHRVRLAHIRQA